MEQQFACFSSPFVMIPVLQHHRYIELVPLQQQHDLGARLGSSEASTSAYPSIPSTTRAASDVGSITTSHHDYDAVVPDDAVRRPTQQPRPGATLVNLDKRSCYCCLPNSCICSTN